MGYILKLMLLLIFSEVSTNVNDAMSVDSTGENNAMAKDNTNVNYAMSANNTNENDEIINGAMSAEITGESDTMSADNTVVNVAISADNTNVSNAIANSSTNLNDIWNSFVLKGSKINKTNLFEQYEKHCPILNGKFFWKQNKTSRVKMGDCLIEKCVAELRCQIAGNCCHRSPYGYLATQIYDTLVYPEQRSIERYLVVSECPYDDIDETKHKCEHTATKPVSSINTEIIYKNSFCAKCHDEEETTDWNLVLICPDVYRSKTQRIVQTCFIQYRPPFGYIGKRLRDTLTFKKPSLISKCNETGLWKVFDRDIDWACRRFQRPYKYFKNLYCYICNPSVISTQIVDSKTIISTCRNDSNLHIENIKSNYFSETNASISEMCKYTDIVPRLSPYRNAYCFSCHEKPFDYFIERNIGKVEMIDSNKYSVKLKITISPESNERFSVNTFKKRVEHLLKLFVNDTKDVQFPFKSNKSARSEGKQEILLRHQNTLIKSWAEICPFDKVCTEPYRGVNIWDMKKLCRTFCVCNQSCMLARNLRCCFENYIKQNAHTCLQESYFPVVKNTRLESSDDIKSHRIIDTCIIDSYNNKNKHKCHNTEPSDLLMNIPVESTDVSILPFQNIFCLLCNFERPVEDVNIYLRVQCRQFFEIDLLPSLRYVVNATKDHQCKVSFALNEQSLKHHKCSLHLDTIVEQNLGFVCSGESSTSKGFGQEIYKLCSNNELPTVLKSFSRQYVHCQICDEHFQREFSKISTIIQCRHQNDSTPSSEHLCFVEDPDSFFIYRSNSYIDVRNNYRSLFAISDSEFKRLKQVAVKKCAEGMFDTKMGVCRRLHCSNGRMLENGSCINMFESVLNTTFLVGFTLQPCNTVNAKTAMESTGNKSTNQTISADEDIEAENICKGINEAVLTTFRNGIMVTNIECHVIAYNCTSQLYGTQNDLNNSPNVFRISEHTIIFANISVHVKFSNHKSQIEEHIYHLSRTGVFRVNQIVLCSSKGFIAKANDFCFNQTFTIPNNTSEHKDTASYDLVKVKKALFCPLVKIKVTKAVVDETAKTIVINYHNAELSVPLDNVDDIRTVNQRTTLWICKSDINLPGQTNLEVTDGLDSQRVYFLFSTSCNTVSILSLVITLLTYSMFKVLRTVPGNNNMSLALCLLLAQASLQFPHVSGVVQTKGHSVQCRVAGLCVHYFWLATFCALNVCSFHMYKVFSGRLMLAQSQLKSVMPKYTLYVYGCPFLIISAVVSVNFATSGSFGYGVYRCFLNDLYSVIAAFLLPSCLIFASNAFFYGKTFYIIYNSPTLRCNIEERSTFLIYVKLCTITGMTWPLLFIDALFPLSVFSFIATFANAMQGFFIFLSFVWNRRVLNLYRNSFSDQHEPNTVDTVSRARSIKRSH